MSDMSKDIFWSFVNMVGGLFKSHRDRQLVASMSPDEFEQWRLNEVAKIHDEAVKLTSDMTEQRLAERGETRDENIRGMVTLMAARRSREMRQNLLAGLNVKGINLSMVPPGHISQEHINEAVGDARTRLPKDLTVPAAWTKAAAKEAAATRAAARKAATKRAAAREAAAKKTVAKKAATKKAAAKKAVAAKKSKK
jgi:hypothetical protein